MIFLRTIQSAKQKPRQWGPLSAVQAAIKDNCNRLGFPAPYAAWLFWEDAGETAHDYSEYDTHATSTSLLWSGNAGYFDSNYSIPLGDPAILDIPNNDGLTIFAIVTIYSFINVASVLYGGADNNDRPGYNLRTILGDELQIVIGNGSERKAAAISPTIDEKTSIVAVVNSGIELSISSYNTKTVTSLSGYSEELNGPDKIIGGSNTDVYYHGLIDNLWVFPKAFTDSQSALFHEQPYALIQPVSRPVYFDLGWFHKINSISSISKINSINVSNISKVIGV